VELDVPLPNKRESDVSVYWKGRTVFLECTVMTESDEDRGTLDRFVKSQTPGESLVLVRPGPYDAENSRSPSPYYDTVRVYDKVYDKLAKGLNPQQSQFPPNSPSILLLSLWAPTAHLDADDLGVRWALDELFVGQPRRRTIAEGEPGIDIGLGGWLDFSARALQAMGKLTVEQYAKDYQQLIAASRGLSGVLVFSGCRLTAARVNYNAHRACRLSNDEMANIETWLRGEPYWV
jgi:hypothetical protein